MFSESVLRELFPIQRGEVYSRGKIAKGLEELRRVYGPDGYINFTPVPSTQFENQNAIANLEVDIDEGKQLRVRSVEARGVDPETKERVRHDVAIRAGEISSSELWEHSFMKFRDLAQKPRPNAVDKRLDEKGGLG